MKGLITCFEDFSNVSENSSRLIVEKLGLPYQILPVSFKNCDQSLPTDLDFIIQVGVAASRNKITIERYAHNLAHSPLQTDNDGHCPQHEVIIANAPTAIETNFSPALIDEINGSWEWSLSAGSYVCNALYFKALYRMPKTKVIFIHVPHHLKSDDPAQSLNEGRELLLDAWAKITENKKAR